MNSGGFKSSRLGNGTRVNSQPKTNIIYGRVIDVILDGFHPEYEKRGNSQSINGVLYRPIDRSRSEEEDQPLEFAFQGDSSIKTIPLKNEIVEIFLQPSETRVEVANSRKGYWLRTVNLWNHPHHNAYPDTVQYNDQESRADLGEDFEELSNINPLQNFPGDISIEGRYGNSIRLSGTKYTSNPWIDSTNNNKPLTIIRNGQKETDNGIDLVLEDINEDSTSIYLASDHTIDLEQANTKRDSWQTDPELASRYKGSQVVINGGRLYFNSRDESILMSSKEAFGVNAKEVHIDGEDMVSLDATKIYLGQAALNREDEPVLLGQRTVDLLEKFISKFEELINTMATMPPAPPAAIAKMLVTANAILPTIPTLKNSLRRLPSEKVFTE